MQSEEKCDIIALYNRYIRTKKEEVVLMAEKLISVDRMETVLSLFGNYDENVNLIQKEYNVVILGRGDDIKITGDEENVFNASEAINSLIALINKGEAITEQTIRYVFTLVREGKQYEIKHMSDDGVCVTVSGKLVKPKTLGQKRYVEAIRKKTIVMGIGPDTFAKQQERGCIEVAPLAYMRGRTLDDSFIILDEAQNTTHEQMKMFLTRLGFNSKIVITGDITQIDLPDQRKSGLIQAMNVLKGIDDISINRFTDKDVVRHKLVQDIILAYEKYNKKGM